jgi:hypothetical protein
MTQKPAANYPKNIAKPTTPPKTQELVNGPRFNTCWKGHMTRSEIYERMLPDKQTATLRIDGPAGNSGFIAIHSSGAITLVTGERNVEKGPGSGKLCIHTHGQQQKHEQRTDIEYSAGDDEENQALNMIAYGDVVEQAVGSTRHIKAQKIVISASEELFLIGKSQVFIQAGSNGGGTITMNAGNVEKITNNDKEIILGQRMTFGVSEDTTVQFDPRATINAVSPGHVNHKILGDYKVWVGGVEQHIIAGKPLSIPFVKDRTASYSVRGLLGNISMTAVVGGADITTGAAFTVAAGGAATVAAGGASTLTAGGLMTLATGGKVSVVGGTGVDIKAVTTNVDITATAGNVDINGLLILLN